MGYMVFFERDGDDSAFNPTSENLLRDAEQLLTLGFTRAAGDMGVQALQRALLEACVALHIWPRDPTTGQKMNLRAHKAHIRFLNILETAGHIKAELQRRVRRCNVIGGKSKHARRIDRSAVCEIVETVHKIRAIIPPAAPPPSV